MSESHTIGIVVVLVRHCPCALCQGGAGGRSDGRRSALPVTQQAEKLSGMFLRPPSELYSSQAGGARSGSVHPAHL